MANKLKGEFTLDLQPAEAGGPMGSLTLVYDWDALEHLEDYMNLGLIEVMIMLNRGFRLKLVRALFWAGIQARHSDVKRADMDDLIDRCGGAFELFGKLGEGLVKAFPTPEAGGDAAPGPQTAAVEAAAAGAPNTVSASGSSTA